jgi:transcriptional regulator
VHPNPIFRQDRDWLAFADARGFAHIFAATPAGSFAVQAPVSRFGDELRFHVARGNRIAPHLDGARVIISITEVDGYISPNWYAGRTNQVPTWNFVGVELEGVARQIDDAGVTEQLDALAARHEPHVNPGDPWTRDKMDDALFRKMLSAITGFAVRVDAVRETVKLGQHKNAADRTGAVAGARAAGMTELADAMARA